MSSVTDVSDATFDAEVLKSAQPVLVDFWAPWCGPCKMVSPLVEQLAKDLTGKLKVVKLNTDDNVGVATQYKIMGIPSLLVFKNGQEVERIVGYQPKEALFKKVSAAL